MPEIALSYSELYVHAARCHDPLVPVLAGKTDPVPKVGFALAGKSTLNQLELIPVGAFVVTSLSKEASDAATIYEQEYRARGDM